jgi:hypothetical protein
MTGGYDMHIHGYQIQNVLNVYRQQLSRGTVRNGPGGLDMDKAATDRIDIADYSQRKTLFEKISSEIVERITQFKPEAAGKASFSGQFTRTMGDGQDEVDSVGRPVTAFSYTLIDANNRKTTQNLSIRQLNLSNEKVESLMNAHTEGKTGPDSE